MGKRLQGRNAVVTGGGRGIGREIALALAAEGAKVVVNGVTTKPEEGHQLPPAEETAADIKKAGGTAIACRRRMVRASRIWAPLARTKE